jgi:hypothetical protein
MTNEETLDASEAAYLRKYVAELEAELARLRPLAELYPDAYAKIMGVLWVYMTCEQMVKGEAYRDLEATWRHLRGATPPDAERGWPACFAREAEGRKNAEAEAEKWRGLYDHAWAECQIGRAYYSEPLTDVHNSHDEARRKAGLDQ